MQDLRFAFRTLRRSPGFAVAAIATLALAMGANTAMFSVVNAVLLRPLPYRAPEQLAMIWTERPSEGLGEGRSAYWNVEQWRRHSNSFSDIAVWDPLSATLTNTEGAERISILRISPNFFPMVGVQPALGRLFSDEEAEQRHRVALISHRFWQSRFGGSREAIGATIVIDGRPSQIVGVLPAGRDFASDDVDVVEPHTMFPDWEARRGARGAGGWYVTARLRPGVTFDQAQAEMSAIARRLDEQLTTDRDRGVSIVPLSQSVIGSRSRLVLWLLSAAIGAVLLIAGANVASLSIARSIGRAREMAVRAALGASRMRIVRQLLAESVTLAAVSGLLGTLLAFAAVRVVRTLELRGVPRLDEVDLDLRVLGWAVAISFVTGILVGLAPALTMMRRSLRPGEEGGRGVSGGVATQRIRRVLVVTEFALAIVLLVGAGLLVRSWWHVERIDSGFSPEQTLSLALRAPNAMPVAQRPDFYHRLLEQIQSVPGVERAGMISNLFVAGNSDQVLTAERDVRTTSERMPFRTDEVTGGFFAAIGTPLLRGRSFSTEDGPDAPPVAIVNEAMARRLWPGLDPIGRRFKRGPASANSPWMTVVGVVADMRRQGPERAPVPQIFEPLSQNPSQSSTILLVRTSMDDPLEMVPALRAAVRLVEKQAPIYGVTTLDQLLGTYLAPRRFQTLLVVAFSVVALLMAAIGIYGLIQYSIATRTQEIGIRMAIGAQAGDIFRMIIGEGLRLSLTGLAVGLVGALWVGEAASSLLFGVTATDPATFTVVSLLLTGVALAACYFPARRAMKIEPIVALQRQ